MAWLVLQLTGSSLALGAVLTVQAVPRALLMLVGGAIADRISARLTMSASMALRVLCAAPLALLVLTNHVAMWEVYVLSAVFGIVGAFFYPAHGAVLPSIVAREQLEPANAVMNITRQTSVIIGPAVAGLMVARAGMSAIVALGEGNIPRLSSLTLDPRVLLFSIVLSTLCAVLFGAAPAIRAARTRPGEVLRGEGRGFSAGGDLGIGAAAAR